MKSICRCGRVHRYHENAKCVLCPCGFVVYGDCSAPPDPPEPVDRVPLWVRLVSKLRIESDAGVGDTVQRIAAKVGGERFKKIAAEFGIECGCTDRQIEWNRRFPY